MKSIVVGLGIGNLYKSVLEHIGNEVVTVDTDSAKNPTYTDLSKALTSQELSLNGKFVTGHVCTPNFTHYSVANTIAPYCDIVFVEKPGVRTADEWQQLVDGHPDTKFILVKNNMWRSNIKELREHAQQAESVELNWINKDRVPSPGTWFTTMDLAFGGVSRDLMPHLLSLYMAFDDDWRQAEPTQALAHRRYELSELSNTDYGEVNTNGVYNVDDLCKFSINKYKLTADWRDTQSDKRNIIFSNPDYKFELGLCPELAYENMIRDCIYNRNTEDFWQDQLEKDLWIHKQIENL
jgi:predicted dehydrogenase